MRARTGRRPPAIPPAIEATGEVKAAMERWFKAWEDFESAERALDFAEDTDPGAVGAALSAIAEAERRESGRWHELTTVVPLRRDAAYRLGPYTVAVSAASRSGLVHVAYRDGVEVRRSRV